MLAFVISVNIPTFSISRITSVFLFYGLHFSFQILNYLLHLFIFSWLALRDLLLSFNFVCLSLHFFKGIIHFLFKVLYHLQKVIFKVIFFSSSPVLECSGLTVVEPLVSSGAILFFILLNRGGVPSPHLYFQSMQLYPVPLGVPHPSIGTGGLWVW